MQPMSPESDQAMTTESSQQPPVLKGMQQDTGAVFAASADQSLFASMRQALKPVLDLEPVHRSGSILRTCTVTGLP